jgi:glucose/mannose-6-phosphate isomerase
MEFLEMCKDAILISEQTKLPKYKFNKVVVAGMGGSAAGGEIAKDFLRDKMKIPVEVSRGFDLPYYANKETLVFCVSYSGNTKETLSQFEQALKKKCKIICVTSNGKLVKRCKKLKIPFISVPKGLLPREAFPYLFFPLLIYLKKLKLVKGKELEHCFDVFDKIQKNKIKELAKELKNSIVFIYASSHLEGVANRIKNQLNENSKLIAKVEILPELMHNEIESLYEKRKDVAVIFLRDNKDRKINKYFKILRELMGGKFKIFEIYAKGSSELAKIIYLVYFGELLSIEIAKERGVNYRETKNINFVKSKI